MDKNEIQRQTPTGREDKNRNSSAGKKKSGSPMSLFSWTKLNFTLWALIAIAVIIIIFRFCSSTKNDSLPTVSVDDKIDVTSTIITSMKEIGEWEFLSVTDEELVDTTRKGFLRDDKLVRIYYGKLSLGINMHKAEPHWARMQGDSVIITLPGIELLDKRFDKCGVIGEDAVLEVALLLALRAHPRARQIGRTEIRLNAVDDDALEMHA